MKILNHEIPTKLEDNSFITSLHKQSLIKQLSNKQLNTLEDMLEIRADLQGFDVQKVKVYRKSFYRTDYHGDYLRDTMLVYDVNEDRLNDKIQDAHAAQYSSEAYVKEFEYVKEATIPANITNTVYFMNTYFDDYTEIYTKLDRDKFRKVKTRNAAVRAMNSLTGTKDVDEDSINKSLGRGYKW